MPEPVANNAVCEGITVNGERFVYSFAGIDSSKSSSGIHLKSWRYSLTNNQWESIADLPDTLGKVAAGASFVKGVAYIIGGYHVFSNGNEVSSRRTHRYDCSSNSFLADGADIPVAIDDHVQAVWKDSLIYVVTGWRNTTNVINVQIYNPSTDSWMAGTSLPNNNTYKSFGASGVIDGNRIYYFGGASLGLNFPIQPFLRIGEIDPTNPQNITWSDSTFGTDTALYRAAAIMLNHPTWIGGSRTTYNYDGIAYNGSGGVSPAAAIQQWNGENMTISNCDELNMDLRGAANFPFSGEVFLAGGMEESQQVSDRLVKLRYNALGLEEFSGESLIKVYPNPGSGRITIETGEPIQALTVINGLGQVVFKASDLPYTYQWAAPDSMRGFFTLIVETKNGSRTERVIVQ